MRIDTEQTNFSSDDDQAYVWLADASSEAVERVLSASPEDADGRSQWVWLRFPNGDLALAIFPQGDTYFAVEEDAARSYREHTDRSGS